MRFHPQGPKRTQRPSSSQVLVRFVTATLVVTVRAPTCGRGSHDGASNPSSSDALCYYSSFLLLGNKARSPERSVLAPSSDALIVASRSYVRFASNYIYFACFDGFMEFPASWRDFGRCSGKVKGTSTVSISEVFRMIRRRLGSSKSEFGTGACVRHPAIGDASSSLSRWLLAVESARSLI